MAEKGASFLAMGPYAQMSDPQGYRADINALRAFAVCVVVLFHLGVEGLKGGFIGVDIFFVLSGFLMAQVCVSKMDAGGYSYRDYFWARFSRIVPALLLVVLVTLGYGLILIDPHDLEVMAKHARSSLLFFSNWTYLREFGYFDAAAKEKWFLHTWSLSVEWQFYLIFPIFISVAYGFGRRALLAVVVTLLVASLGSMLFLVHVRNSSYFNSFAFYMLPTRAWEMCAGAIAFFLSEKEKIKEFSERYGNILSPMGWLVLILVAIFAGERVWPSIYTVIPVLVSAALVVLGARHVCFDWPIISWFGKSSYSIYLWHWPIIVALGSRGGGGVILILLLSALSYRFVEMPVQLFLRKGYKEFRFSVVLGAIFSSALVVAGVLVLQRSNGAVSRVQGDATLYADAVAASVDRGYDAGKCSGFGPRGYLYCDVGKGPVEVWVVGDSFAEMWWARALAVHNQGGRNVRFITAGGCPPVSTVRREPHYLPCQRIFEKIFLDALADGQLKTIVFAAKWDGYFYKYRPELSVSTPSGWIDLKERGAGLALEQFIEAALQVKSHGKRVAVFTTAPYPGIDVPRILRRDIYSGNHTVGEEFSVPSEGERLADEVLLSAAARGIEVVDLQKFFCENRSCPQLSAGKSIYSDDSHFRSSWLAEMKSSPLDRFLLPAAQ